MGSGKPASWVYAEQFGVEDAVLGRARARAAELGCEAVSPSVGALLQVMATSTAARNVVEIGTGAGVSGLYLLRGLPAGAQFTTIEPDVRAQRAAKRAFAEDGVPSGRTRTILGDALEVLPRLADGAYDVVFVDGGVAGAPVFCAEAVRLLRPGGLLALNDALWRDHVADPARRDRSTALMRDLGRALRDDDGLVTALLPSGDGLLLAARR